jgi:hypothetical protein
MKRIFIRWTFLFLLLLSMPDALRAQDMDDGDGTVPVDGGISLLLAAGAAYGVRRLKRRGA